MIKEDTILSSFDKKLTLLQWLKALDKNITELQEKGINPSFNLMTIDEFLKQASIKPTGVDFLAFTMQGEIWVIAGTYEVTRESEDYASIHCVGLIANIYGETGERASRLSTDGTLEVRFEGTEWTETDYNPAGAGCNFSTTEFIYDTRDNLQRQITDITNSTSYKLLTRSPLDYSRTFNLTSNSRGYGIGKLSNANENYGFGRISGVSILNSTRKLQGFFTKGDDEIYYSTGTAIVHMDTGEIENAISGTELKEAVRLATQKTFWHSVRIQGANGSFSFNAPSTLNTPVDSIQDLTTLFEGDKWEGFGKYSTNFLLEIDLSTAQPEFTTDSGTSVGLAQFGNLTITDDVKTIGG